MSKKTTLLVLVVALAVVAYAGAWFYRAEQTKRFIDTQIENLKKQHIIVGYDALKVEGFPFAFRVVAVNPKLSAEQNPAGGGTLKAALLTVSSNVIGTRYQISLSNDLYYSVTAEGQKQDLLLHYTEVPEIVVAIDKSIYLQDILDFGDVVPFIRGVHYQDKGYVISDAISKTIFSSAENTLFDYVLESNKRRRIATTSAAIKNIDNKEVFLQKTGAMNLGRISLVVSVKLTSTYEDSKNSNSLQEQELVINDASFASDKLTVQAQGLLNSSAKQIMPSGQLFIKVQHPDQLTMLLKKAGAIPDEAKFKELLTKISTKTEKPDEVSVKIERDPKSDLSVGGMGLMQLLPYFTAE